MAKRPLHVYVLWALTAINIGIVLWRCRRFFLYSDEVQVSHDDYSYIGGDFPLYYPLVGPSLDTYPVALTFRESVRFEYNKTDQVAFDEWYSILKAMNFGRVRLGPENRVFTPVHYHEMHCVRILHIALLNPAHEGMPKHVKHCLNYLRQWLLCEATDTVEKGDFLEIDYESDADRVGETRICQDWERVYADMDGNHERWLEFKKAWT
ncbi:hypothetical protein IW261DRAFT_1459157 [Armillaria novae-zelandiae]|uniref:Uncharacterized protein n=1 Tax=Armillaria novae-zelandiae TaxID=153914 RepID=A0AA39PJ69_9AGAR|nr:hypothetical protein IW261DRAFT_1459157 [Armillaria novae-zelandiae]